MPKRLSLSPHLSVGELEQRYRQACDPVQRSQFQIVWLLASGKHSQEVAQVTGYSLRWVRIVARRYNQLGPEGVGDARHHNPGATALLDDIQQAHLVQALQGPAPGGGQWNGPKVAQWMSELLGRSIHPQRGWEYLKALEHRLRVPRPAHVNGDIEQQQQWKKTSSSDTHNCSRLIPK